MFLEVLYLILIFRFIFSFALFHGFLAFYYLKIQTYRNIEIFVHWCLQARAIARLHCVLGVYVYTSLLPLLSLSTHPPNMF